MLETLCFQWNESYEIVRLSQSQVFQLHKVFSEVREITEHLPSASRPSTSVKDDNIVKVKIRDIAEDLIIFYRTLSSQQILGNVLGIKRVNTRLVLKNLNL